MTHRLLLPLCLALVLGACRPAARYVTVEGSALGTTYSVKARTTLPEATIYARIAQLDTLLRQSMSIFDEGSLLSRINRGETDSVDEHIAYNILAADSVSRLSEGMFDITVKPLTEAWGFAGRHGLPAPNVDSILRFVGYRRIALRDGRLVREDPRIQLDFNSIGKGYMVDLAARWLEEQGCADYLVTLAGSGRCRGVNPAGEPWRIGIDSPVDNNFGGVALQRIVRVTGRAYATSGNYRRFYYAPDGRKIAHTIDPHTGYSSVTPLLSATVFCGNAARADALGTMFMALGPERAVEKARELEASEGVLCYFIFATDKADGRSPEIDPGDFRIWASDGLLPMFDRPSTH